MTRRVVLTPEARDDVRGLYLFIANHSGDVRAAAFVGRIEAVVHGLAEFPERGLRRDDLRPGLRVIGFRRRVSIAFAVTDDAVMVLRILYGGRDLGAAFHEEVG